MSAIERRPAADPDRAQHLLRLTVEDIAHQLALIAANADDPEVAHDMEDQLHETVLRAVAAGHPDGPLLAAAALRTDDIDFDRWSA